MLQSLFRKGTFTTNANANTTAGSAASTSGNSTVAGVAEEVAAVSSLPISTIKEVCKGVQTEVLGKAGLVDPQCCFSIVTDNRTLDLSVANLTERDRIVKGLQILLEGKNVRFTWWNMNNSFFSEQYQQVGKYL